MTTQTPEYQPQQGPAVSAPLPQGPGQQGPFPPMQVAARPPIGGLSIATFVVAFFAGLIAVVLGVFALRQNWVRGTRGTGLAWAGIIIGAINCVAFGWIVMLIVWAATRA